MSRCTSIFLHSVWVFLLLAWLPAVAQVTPLSPGGTCRADTMLLDNPLRSGPSWCIARTVSDDAVLGPEVAYKQALQVTEEIAPLGPTPFGEQIGLYNGSLSFEQVDVRLPGTGPTIEIRRSYEVPSRGPGARPYTVHALSDWVLELPRIETFSARDTGHKLSEDPLVYDVPPGPWSFLEEDGTPRCSGDNNATLPVPTEKFAYSDGPHPDIPIAVQPDRWWSGYQLIIPGAGSQTLLAPSPGNTQLPPPMNGATFNSVTKAHWAVGCLATTSNGEAGQGFLAVSPNGTRYWLDRLVAIPALAVKASNGDVESATLPRQRAMMLVSKIKDRFGNEVTFQYDDAHNHPERLLEIHTSDARSLVLHYDDPQHPGVLHRVTVSGTVDGVVETRTWTYRYVTKILSSDNSIELLGSVTLPDNSQWTFDLDGLYINTQRDGGFVYSGAGSYCQPRSDNATWSGNSGTGEITTPSGLHGSFTVKAIVRSRADVPEACAPVGVNQFVASTPIAYGTAAIESKFVTGAGLPSRMWQYDYSAPNGYFNGDCPACAGTRWTEVTDPQDHQTRHTFSERFDYSESLLQKTEWYETKTSASPLRTLSFGYAAPASGTWPEPFGDDLQVNSNKQQTGSLASRDERTFLLPYYDAYSVDAYTWKATGFNEYAQVTRTQRRHQVFNTWPPPGDTNTNTSRTSFSFWWPETTTYRNDTSRWVLGLPLIHTNVNTGDQVSRFEYDPADNTLRQRWSFGRKFMDYSFNASGQLESFTDARGNTTTLSNYHRGIPQRIRYADQTTKRLVVDYFGQIQSIADESGDTTTYNYDLLGRLKNISYPNDDTVDWSQVNITYQRVTTGEYGVNGEHLRVVRDEGANRHVTVYDAALNPVLTAEFDSTSTEPGKRGHMTWRDFDAEGRVQFASYPLSYASTIYNDTPGVTRIYDALGRVTESVVDSEIGPLTTRTKYLSGNRIEVTDPKGHVTTTTYQAFDMPTYDAAIYVDFNGITSTSISRDFYGKPLFMDQYGTWAPKDGSLPSETISVTHSFAYDRYQRLCSTYSPETGRTIMGYDGTSDLVRWSAAGQGGTVAPCAAEPADDDDAKIVRSYDARDRLLKIDYAPIGSPNGTPDTEFTYYLDGQVHTANRGNAHWLMTYNHRGLLTKEELTDVWLQPDSVYSLIYTYNALGHRDSIRYPLELPKLLSPDALGRPTQVGSFVTAVKYAPNGRPSHFRYSSGVEFDEVQNARGLPAAVSYFKGATVYANRTFAYDANGNLRVISDNDPGGPGFTKGVLRPQSTDDRSFVYDELDRLTDLHSGWIAEDGPASVDDHYEYDSLGNLRYRQYQYVHPSDGPQVPEAWYFYDTHNRVELISPDSSESNTCAITHTYDLRGNLTHEYRPTDSSCPAPPAGISDFELTFNLANELVKDAYDTSFAYDARGWRFMKHFYVGENVPARYGVRETFVYDAVGLLRQRNRYGISASRYYFLGNRPIARTDGSFSALTYIYPNYQNSPLFETDSTGTVTRSLTFYGYGQPSGPSCIHGEDPCELAMRPLGLVSTERKTRKRTGGSDLILPELEHAPGYTGSYPDRETGLLYMGARYQHGPRFISPDPAPLNPLHPTGLNRYAYANNNPVRFTDPNGEFPVAAAIAACAATPCKYVVASALVGGAILAKKAGEAAADYFDQVMQNESGGDEGNTNPYDGPVDEPVIVVDGSGNAIPVGEGGQIGASDNGDYQQVKDRDGNPTGDRLDRGGHRGHADPKARAPHGHRPGVTDEAGNPHLPVNPPKPPRPFEPKPPVN